MTRRQWIAGVAAALAVVAFGTSWSHCVDVLEFGGQPQKLSWVIASLPEVTCLLVALRLMDGERGWLTWTVGAIGFGFTVAANASTAGGHVAPGTHWVWAYLGALWPAVSTVLAFVLMSHGDPTRSTTIESAGIGQAPDLIASIESTRRSTAALRSVESRPIRSTLPIEQAPVDPPASIEAPTPIRSGRPDRPDWTTRSAIGPGAGSGRPLDALAADLRSALGPADPIPSAESIRLHYAIGPAKARALRDALKTDRTQDGAGGVQGEIN